LERATKIAIRDVPFSVLHRICGLERANQLRAWAER
jgi:hypothetical protein